MTASHRWAGAAALAILALACIGGCQSIYGIGDLPQAAPDAEVNATADTDTDADTDWDGSLPGTDGHLHGGRRRAAAA